MKAKSKRCGTCQQIREKLRKLWGWDKEQASPDDKPDEAASQAHPKAKLVNGANSRASDVGFMRGLAV
jgi:hypothetical protein